MMSGFRLTSLVLVIAACGHHDHTTGDGGLGSNVESLAVTPGQVQLALAAQGTGYAATQAFTVTATLTDGTKQNVTSDVTWTASDTTISFAGADATFTAAGNYTVTASYDSGS